MGKKRIHMISNATQEFQKNVNFFRGQLFPKEVQNMCTCNPEQHNKTY